MIESKVVIRSGGEGGEGGVFVRICIGYTSGRAWQLALLGHLVADTYLVYIINSYNP